MVSTIYHVAEKAKVSIATVSRVLQRHPQVSGKTRQAVLAAVKALRYTPNIAAQSFSSKRTNLIGVFGYFATDHSEPFIEILRGVIARLEGTRFALYTCSWTARSEADYRLLRDMTAQNFLCGAILLNRSLRRSVLDGLKQNGVPVVSCEHLYPDTDNILVDNLRGGYLAGRHLIERGHRRIAVLAGDHRHDWIMRERIRGLRKALKEAHLTLSDDLIFPSILYNFDDGVSTARKMMALKRPPDAIFSIAGDQTALGSLKTLLETGVPVPGRMAVVGYDDMPIANYYHPALTSVRQPLFDMGRIAADCLIGTLEGSRRDTETIVLQPSLVIRQTT